MNPMSRRRFLELAGAASAALAAAKCIPQGKKPYVESADLPTLGGAPDTPEGHTIAAFVDTVVPGKHRDPLSVAGGIDVGAPGQFFAPDSQIQTLVPLLVLSLDGFASSQKNKSFAGLEPSERDEVLDYALSQLPELSFAVQLAKVSYYASAEASAHLGYPGANTGYMNDANFGFRQPMADPLPIVENNGNNYP
jgi:hypothetical protein